MENRKIIIVAVVAAIVILLIIILGTTLGKDVVIENGYADILVKTECPKDYGSKPTLVVCMDGFKAEYLKRDLTPTIREFADAGVEAEYMMPSYPTVTFPNHYTIVTGLYPESHGIIGNKFFDPVFEEKFSLGSNSVTDGKWWGGEPIWNTLVRNGKRSATYFWPGSEALIGGRKPTYWMKFNKKKTFQERINQVLEWLMLPVEERPLWISLYFEEPDSKGHAFGPDSEEMTAELERMDYYIRTLLEGLIQRDIINCINIIILSDHGLSQAGKEKALAVTDYIPDIKEYASFYGGASGKIIVKNQSKEVELDIMRQLSCKRDEMRVYSAKGLPKRLHFASSRRIADIIVDVDSGYSMILKATDWSMEGFHGYDNIFPDMNTIFLAHGPDFKSKLKVGPFQNIELYNLMCHLTGVSPVANNGTWGSLHHLLLDPPVSPQLQKLEKPPVLRYPKDNLENHAVASGCEGDTTILEPWMLSLDLTKVQEEELDSYHAPWGLPSTNITAVNISLLYHMDHITGYSTTVKMPLWTSFTIRPDQIDGFQNISDDATWSSDARLSPEITPTCAAYDILMQSNFSVIPLFPSAFSSNLSQGWESSHLISNAIPVSQDIRDHWQGLLSSLAPSWIAIQGPLNFILGPAFDYDSDSHPDDFAAFREKPTVPTDIFCVLTGCQTAVKSLDQCPAEKLDSMAFIFHQNQPIHNCLSLEDYSLKFSSRVKDVELITGLSLFPDVSFEQRVHHILKMRPQLWPLH